MNRVIEKRGDFDLLELDDSWLPWRFQIVRRSDGDSYGRPGQRIISSVSNFVLEEKARFFFSGAK